MLTYKIGGMKTVVENKFESTNTKFDVDPSKITYLGDFIIDWKGADESVGAGEVIGGLIGGFIAGEQNKSKEGVVTINTVNHIDETKNYLETKFNKPVEIVFFPLGK